MSSVHDPGSLHRIDTNLLVALDALVHERSVTRAAARAGVSQSAMSHTLRKLRDLFEDPLLVRGTGGLLPTPRAEALVVPIRRGLLDLARALAQPDPFDPARSTRTFSLAAPDLLTLLAVPALTARLREAGPGLGLSVQALSRGMPKALETGALDCAIWPVALETDVEAPLHPDLRQRVLFRDGLRCFARPGHPGLPKRRLSLQRYLGLDHLLVSPTGSGPGPADLALARLGEQRCVRLRVPDFASALAVVAQTDLVLTAPTVSARASTLDLIAFDLPFSVPGHALTLVWHPRFGTDPAQQWFRDVLAQEVLKQDELDV